jgi:hypothetical protein
MKELLGKGKVQDPTHGYETMKNSNVYLLDLVTFLDSYRDAFLDCGLN